MGANTWGQILAGKYLEANAGQEEVPPSWGQPEAHKADAARWAPTGDHRKAAPEMIDPRGHYI